MATPLPTGGNADRSLPHGDEAHIVQGLASAPAAERLTGLQAALLRTSGTMSRASEVGAMTAKPRDATATAQEGYR